jgi:CheY-like chemotaxis protein
MSNLLLLSHDAARAETLGEAARAVGYRVKTAADSDSALEWLKLRDFSVVTVDSSVSLDDQQLIAAALWRKNSSVPFVVVELDAETRRAAHEARLFGADIITQPEAITKYARLLESILPRGPLLGENFKILVVEDLDAPRDIICAFIEGLGFPSVKGAASAREALDMLEREPDFFSCIVTDIRMPEISGKELIEQVRRHGRLQHLPIIVLTAHGTGDCLVDCLKAGASGFLVKPPKKNDLSRELGRAVRIMTYGMSPRLASSDEAEQMRELLAERGI